MSPLLCFFHNPHFVWSHRVIVLRVNKVISGPKCNCRIQSCIPPAGRRLVVLLTSPRGSSLSRFAHLAWHFESVSPWLVTGPGKCCALLLHGMCNLPVSCMRSINALSSQHTCLSTSPPFSLSLCVRLKLCLPLLF